MTCACLLLFEFLNWFLLICVQPGQCGCNKIFPCPCRMQVNLTRRELVVKFGKKEAKKLREAATANNTKAAHLTSHITSSS